MELLERDLLPSQSSQPHQMRRRTLLAGTLAGIAISPMAAWAQFKETVRFVLPFPPGGTLDALARLCANHMSTSGWNVVIENKPGANGFLAAQAVLQAPPDGLTVLVSTPSVIASNVVLYKNIPYDPQRDFDPVARLFRSHAVLVTGANAPYKSYSDLAAAAQGSKEFTFAAGAPGYIVHFHGIRQILKMKAIVAQYRGTVAALRDVVSGVADLSIGDPTAVYPMIDAGLLRPLAVLGDNPDERLAGVPTSVEVGLGKTEIFWWSSAFVRRGTPADRIAALREALRSAVENPGLQAAARRYSARPYWGDEQALRESQAAEIQVYRRHAAEAGLVAQ